MSLSCTIRGQRFSFSSIKEVLAKANEEKSGDQLAGIGAESEVERVAAKQVLSEITLSELRANPVVPYEQDEVTRLIDESIKDEDWQGIKNWTVGELREYLLAESTTDGAGAPPLQAESATDGAGAPPLQAESAADGAGAPSLQVRRALTGEMAAAVAKLMSNLDLLRASKRCSVVARANTTLGLPGRLGARLQPNHPSDAIDGVMASIYEGLAYGVGDAVIGINPVYDTPESVERLLRCTDEVITALELPTQNCVLSHVTTQMKAIERGAPAGLIFQSIAGSEAGNTAFGITVSLLKEARELGLERCKNSGGMPMYFETGQGSELSSRSHNDADQLTLEARCYALARCFNPFLVNDVVGFIGPEYLADGRQMIRAGLEDHFMGKLLGVPMGIDACYTNHMNADQNDLENLAVLLVAGGVNYFMGVPLGDDVMLSYQTTSYHDIATLRQLMNCRPAPEFEAWLEARGLMFEGKLTNRAGNAEIIYELHSAARAALA